MRYIKLNDNTNYLLNRKFITSKFKEDGFKVLNNLDNKVSYLDFTNLLNINLFYSSLPYKTIDMIKETNLDFIRFNTLIFKDLREMIDYIKKDLTRSNIEIFEYMLNEFSGIDISFESKNSFEKSLVESLNKLKDKNVSSRLITSALGIKDSTLENKIKTIKNKRHTLIARLFTFLIFKIESLNDNKERYYKSMAKLFFESFDVLKGIEHELSDYSIFIDSDYRNIYSDGLTKLFKELSDLSNKNIQFKFDFLIITKRNLGRYFLDYFDSRFLGDLLVRDQHNRNYIISDNHRIYMNYYVDELITNNKEYFKNNISIEKIINITDDSDHLWDLLKLIFDKASEIPYETLDYTFHNTFVPDFYDEDYNVDEDDDDFNYYDPELIKFYIEARNKYHSLKEPNDFINENINNIVSDELYKYIHKNHYGWNESINKMEIMEVLKLNTNKNYNYVDSIYTAISFTKIIEQTKMKFIENFDYTNIVINYFKSIEQISYAFVDWIFNGPLNNNGEYLEKTFSKIKKPIGTEAWEKDYPANEIRRACSDIINKNKNIPYLIRNDLYNVFDNWAINYRNSKLHQNNIYDREFVNEIIENSTILFSEFIFIINFFKKEIKKYEQEKQ